MLHRLLIPLVVASSAVAAAIFLLPSAASPAVNTKLFAYVNEFNEPAHGIWLKRTPTGPLVTHLDPGTYEIDVDDRSAMSSFHLKGPGVDIATGIEEVVHTTWTVTFTDGTYHYFCDFLPQLMKGSFTVGNLPPPPPPPPPAGKLSGRVTTKAISLTNGGSKVRSLTAKKYKITVSDTSKTQNFHLTGPGLNKKTGVAAKAKATWTVALKPGKYRYRSDKSRKLRGTFTVKAT